jgi:hypothetical protein
MENIYQNLNQFFSQHKYDINMPFDAQIRINQEWRSFIRTEKLLGMKDDYSSVNREQIDHYEFFENISNPQISLHTFHIRHYEEKRIAEVYFIKFIRNKKIEKCKTFYSPVYLYERFVKKEDFEPYKEGIADITDMGRIWIDIDKSPNAFKKQREEAYLKANDECFYNWVNSAPNFTTTNSKSLEEHFEKYRKRWKIKKDGTSSYFAENPTPWSLYI